MNANLTEFLESIHEMPLFQTQVCLGVDVGTYGVKVFMPSKTAAPFAVKACHFEAMANGLDAQRLTHYLTAAKLKNTAAAFALSDDKVEIQDFKLPSLQGKELKTAIQWELEKTGAASELTYHDVLTAEVPDGVEVSCIVVARDIVKSRYDEGLQIGFKPKFLETESQALLACAKMMRKNHQLEKAVILDLGHSSFRLIFIHANRITFLRNLYVGLGQVIQSAQDQSGITVRAEEVLAAFQELKLDAGINYSSPFVHALERAIQENLYTLCEEFRRSEFFARDQKGLPEVEEVLICGGGACIPLTFDYLAKHLSDKKVSKLNPLEMAKSIPVGIEKESGPLWACACGLAARGVL